MKRRDFLKNLLAAGIVIQIPWYISCQSGKEKPLPLPQNEVLDTSQKEIVIYFLKNFFPDVPGSPSIEDLNTYYHINSFLSDPNVDPDEQKYFINGIQWIKESANENFNKDFVELSQNEKRELIKKVIETGWGTNWSSKLLTLTFESLLLDPLYYINLDEAGWKWLHHQPGSPRPGSHNHYKKLLARKKEDIIITDLSQL